MEPRSLAFRTDLAVLELSGTQVTDRGDHLVVRTPDNPTFWWGNFLLLADVPPADDIEAWQARFAEEFPDAQHMTFGIDGTDRSVAELAGLTAHGFDVDGSTVLTAHDVDEPPYPNRVARCRPLTSDDDWRASVELRMRCDADEHDPVADRPFVTAKAASARTLVAAGHGAWFGAFLDGALVAQLGVVRAGDGLTRFQTVETDPDHRRQGLCGTLVHHAAQFARRELGATTQVMVADPDYAAIRIYTALGFTAAETQLQAVRRPGSASG